MQSYSTPFASLLVNWFVNGLLLLGPTGFKILKKNNTIGPLQSIRAVGETYKIKVIFLIMTKD